MKMRWDRALLLTCLLFAAGAALLLSWRTLPSRAPRSVPSAESAPVAASEAASAAPEVMPPLAEPAKPASTVIQEKGRPHIKLRASELTAEETAEFEKKFAEKIKPAVERWCKIYAGHVPFELKDVTADKLRERFGKDSSFYDYGFVINGTTLSVVDDHGAVHVSYLMSPAAALLFQIPRNPGRPKPVSVTKEEILRLLKADSGEDFPANQIAMRPTAYAGAMNGGVSVDVGEGVNADYAPLFRYSMVFGPDGNLACYGRRSW